MISPDLLVYFTPPPKLNPTSGVCYAANAFRADLRVPFLFNHQWRTACTWHYNTSAHSRQYGECTDTGCLAQLQAVQEKRYPKVSIKSD